MSRAANNNNPVIHLKDANTPEDTHELAGTLGMTVGGVAGGILTGVAAGGAMGGIAGPVGAVVGAAVGGAIGGSVAEDIAREINPSLEEIYWEQNHHTREYSVKGEDYPSYRPAYRVGIDGYISNPTKSFEDLEPSLRNNWNIARGDSKLEWAAAQHAARDAFNRLAIPST